MKREELDSLGICDRTGTEIKNGDIFEYENLYIVIKDKETKDFNIFEYENQVEYGVEEDPYYVLVSIQPVYELELQQDQIKGNIFIDRKDLVKYLHND